MGKNRFGKSFVKKNVLAAILCVLVILLGFPLCAMAQGTVDKDGITPEITDSEKNTQVTPSTTVTNDSNDQIQSANDLVTDTTVGKNRISYRTHVQDYGWQDYVSDGTMSGTEGQSKRLEAINIKLVNPEYSGSVRYLTHIQNKGWEQSWNYDDALSGTQGESLRLEAIKIELTGEMADHFDVYYRVHCQNIGWMGWAKNGDLAGTSGYAYRLEGIQVVLVAKGDSAPGETDNAYQHPLVTYNTHVQDYGWQDNAMDGGTSGTVGQAKRLEGIHINLNNPAYSGSIQYRTHIQNKGWESDWKADGMMSGTQGQSLRLEAIQIKLTDAMADNYDVYYRVHCQNFGWMGWAENGESAGSAGYGYRLEGIQIQLVAKDGPAPGNTDTPFRQITQAERVQMAKDGYKGVVNQLYQRYGTKSLCHYSVFDMDNNGVPELVTMEGDAEYNLRNHFYVSNNGQIAEIGSYGGSYSTLYGADNAQSGTLYSVWVSYQANLQNVQQFGISNGTLAYSTYYNGPLYANNQHFTTPYPVPYRSFNDLSLLN